MNKANKTTPLALWLLPLITTVGQGIYSTTSRVQIRYEELAESIRNVYWFKQGLIYDYLSYNIGWYATLDLFYSLFGFDLNAAKWFRVVVVFFCYFSIAWLCLRAVKKWRYAIVPYLAYAISPTLLYFNTLQAQYGIDLVYLPILTALGIISWDNNRKSNLAALLFGFVLSLSFFTYAVFFFSLPFVFIGFVMYGYGKTQSWSQRFPKLILVLVGSLTPIAYLWPILSKFKMWQFYLNLGRSGQTFLHTPNLNDFLINLRHLFGDLFIRADSYNFEYLLPDFSLFFPVIPIIVSLVLLIRFRKKVRIYYPYLVLIGAALSYNLFVIQYKNGPITDSGMRRSTVVLLAMYALFGFGWWMLLKIKVSNLLIKRLLILSFLLLPLHHLLIFVPNISSLAKPSKFVYSMWFYDKKAQPASVVKIWAKELEKAPFPMDCRYLPKESHYKECRYQETFAAFKLACIYSNKECQPIYGYDPKTDQMILLETAIWDSYYWPH